MQLLTVSLGNDGETIATVYPAQNPDGISLVLAPGAGASQRHPFMTACATGLAARGVEVVTFDFPYVHQKRKLPDKAPVLERCFLAVVNAVSRGDANVPTASRIFIGGKSMGGRIATHLAAQARDEIAGVLVFGYPLHPPGRLDQPRTAHLPDVRVPVLIIQGERDAFGTPAEFKSVIETMAAPVTLHVVAGGDHSLSVRSRSRDDVYREVLDRAANWMRSSARV